MRQVCLVLLSVVAFANAAATVNDVLVGDSVVHNIGSLELQLSATAPESEVVDITSKYADSLEDHHRSIVADAIKDTLEGFRDVVVNGNDDIPPLDPLIIDHVGPFLYTAVGVRASADIRDIRGEGLQWYLVDDVTFNALRLSLGVKVTIPRITVTGRYDAHAAIAIINHRAGGNFRVFANRIVTSIDLRLGTNIIGGQLFLRELDIVIDIHDTFIVIEGMTGSNLINSFINSYIQSITQETIQNEMENVSQVLSEELFVVFNDVLKEYTIADLLG